MSVEGYVDGVEEGRLVGWAWAPQDPARVLEVEARIHGAVVARGRAEAFRADLKTAAKGGGRCAFSLLLGPLVGEVDAFALHDGDETRLPGDPAWALGTSLSDERDFLPSTGMAGRLDAFGPQGVQGWAQWLADASRRPELELVRDGQVLARIRADIWRSDLEESRQGDGRWGFEAPAPPELFDGVEGEVELCIADGPALLPQPVRAAFPVRPVPAAAPLKAAASPSPLPQGRRSSPGKGPEGAVELSVVVNFHNMGREAQRTLTSLSRDYQRGIGDLNYEVICVDNGSCEPLDASLVAGFGPQFRLWTPAQPSPSPCAPMNAAALDAKGRRIAVMIDGAHVLTPGALAAAMEVMRGDPNATVAIRHWFVGGDQRWLAEAGYRREREDLLFDRIDWPRDGYALFRIGAPIGESSDPWLGGLSESNCLFLSAKRFRDLGGFDEAFDEPGGGFANLDLLRRAADDAPGQLSCLLGEATFHQYHGGSTTNVSEEEVGRKVGDYARRYRMLRGKAFEAVPAEEVRNVGAVRHPAATGLRERPLFPAPLGVTSRVRPGSGSRHLGSGAQAYLQSVYAELGLAQGRRWMGRPLPVAPSDVVALQEIMHLVRPLRIVTTSADPGLLGLVDSLCRLLELDGTQIVLATPCLPAEPLPARTRTILGDPFASTTMQAVERELEADEEVLVLFAPPERPGEPHSELHDYAKFVTLGSYIIYLGSVFGQPWLGYSTRWPKRAIRALTGPGSVFAVDARWTSQVITTCPNGYIRRVGTTPRFDTDPFLDQIDAL